MSDTAVAKREDAPVQVSAGAAFLTVIAAAARDPQVDVAKMGALLSMRERIMEKEAEIAFNEAMNRLQPRLPVINKRGLIVIPGREGKAGQKTPFARYEDIDEAIRPLLCAEGFSVSYDSETTAQGVIWKCILSHSRGHQRTYSMPPMPNDTSGSKNAVQAVGSTNQYARRYSLCNALNIVTKGLDDDGEAAGYVNEKQASTITDMITACELTPAAQAKFLEFAGAESVETIRKRDYERVMESLRKKLQQHREGRA